MVKPSALTTPIKCTPSITASRVDIMTDAEMGSSAELIGIDAGVQPLDSNGAVRRAVLLPAATQQDSSWSFPLPHQPRPSGAPER